MKITICGSMTFAQQMLDIKERLEKGGFEVVLPDNTEEYIGERSVLKERGVGWGSSLEGAKRKIERDLIRKHWVKISQSDAILVVNGDKNGVNNYIGGNSFLEMGFAHILGKKIFVLNPLPELPLIYQELVAMEPVILEGDLNKVSQGIIF